jgi:hypothetical protein
VVRPAGRTHLVVEALYSPGKGDAGDCESGGRARVSQRMRCAATAGILYKGFRGTPKAKRWPDEQEADIRPDRSPAIACAMSQCGQKRPVGSLLQFSGLFALFSRNRSLNLRRLSFAPDRLLPASTDIGDALSMRFERPVSDLPFRRVTAIRANLSPQWR